MKKLILLALFSIPCFAVNSLTITEKGGVTTTNYPVQLGRPFLRGEIANCPQAVIGGTAASAWQADVKTRWDDGTVKYAVIAFLIPSLSANSTVTVTFQNATCSNTALTSSDMLASGYDFNASIQLTNGSTVSASARTMLTNSDYTLWTSGQTAQTIILANHAQSTTCNTKACSTYDMGIGTNSAYKPFRPIFEATFWPTINKVKLRYIGEISNTEALADQTYSLTLTAGDASPATVYTQSSFTHGSGRRWSVSLNNQSGQTWTISTAGGNITVGKEIWIGGTPAPISINHNLAYLASTKQVYNYDSTVTASNTAISTWWSSFTGSSPWTIGATGLLERGMQTAGGRFDIGPFDGWSTEWLHGFDKRPEIISQRNSELAGWWPVHFREGNSAKKITRTAALACTYQCDVSGVGRVLSITSRPTIYTQDFTYGGIASGDNVNVITMTQDSWAWSTTHVQEYQAVPYILTGDYFFLEELLFWGSNSMAAEYQSPYSRYPNGYEGNIGNEVEPRKFAWNLRARLFAANFAPDNTPEKSYFELGLKDGIAFAEGWHNITGSALYNNSYFRAAWDSGKSVNVDIDYVNEGTPPAWHPWDHGNTSLTDDPDVDYTVALGSASLWMQNYVTVALGLGVDYGYATDTLLAYQAAHLNSVLTDATYNPYLIGQYREPAMAIGATWFANLAAVKNAYLSSARNRTNFSQGTPTTDSYPAYTWAAQSFVANYTNGTAARSWLNTNVNAAIDWTADPTWNILPRSATPPSAPTVTTTTATSITTVSASSGGNVTSDGGDTVTSRGVCYATTANPTTPCTSDGTGTGVFTSTLSSLSSSTLYHYRAFATNSAGTSYGSDLTFTTDTPAPTAGVTASGKISVVGKIQ